MKVCSNKLLRLFSCWPLAIFALLAIVKILLVNNQHLFALGFASHDDRHFINLAESLTNGQWLGAYDNLTLAKGVFYPVWIAISRFFHVRLLLSENILYIASCLVMVVAFNPIVKKDWQRVILFTVLLFNPVSYSTDVTTRVIREAIYSPLTMLVIASFVGLLLRYKDKSIRLVWWAMGAGISLSCFWLTREEGVWIIPAVGMLTSAYLYLVWKKRLVSWPSRLILLVVPFLILLCAITAVSFINYKKYNIYTTVEFKSHSFLAAYGAITRVKEGVWYPDTPSTREARLKIATLSSSYAKISPNLDSKDNGWINTSASSTGNSSREILGGWFMWAFRDAVASAGYYKDGKTASDFYTQLALEINNACSERKLDCSPERAAMNAPWDNRYLRPLVITFAKTWTYVINLTGNNPSTLQSVGDRQSLDLFSSVTGEKIYTDTIPNDRKTMILRKIGNLYSSTLPIACLLAVLAFGYLLFKKRSRLAVWISFALLTSVTTRLALLSYITVSSFNSIFVLYFSPVYPLIITSVLIIFFSVFRSE